MLFCLAVTDKSELWFCASVCACSAHGTCQSLLSFLNELHWEMRVYLIWSLRGGIRPVSLYHTHRGKRKLLFLQHVRSSWMHTHAHTQAACIKTDTGRGRHKDTYVHMCRNLARFLDIFYYSNAPVSSNEHSLSSSFRQRERHQPKEEEDVIAYSWKHGKSWECESCRGRKTGGDTGRQGDTQSDRQCLVTGLEACLLLQRKCRQSVG